MDGGVLDSYEKLRYAQFLKLDAAAAGTYATEHLIADYAKLNIYDGANTALFDANGKLVAKRKSVYDDLNWFDAVERTKLPSGLLRVR